jgi:hypothetical protein
MVISPPIISAATAPATDAELAVSRTLNWFLLRGTASDQLPEHRCVEH